MLKRPYILVDEYKRSKKCSKNHWTTYSLLNYSKKCKFNQIYRDLLILSLKKSKK